MKLRGITSGLQRRLLLMLIAPLLLLAFANAWFDYRSADTVAAQQDQRLLAILRRTVDDRKRALDLCRCGRGDGSDEDREDGEGDAHIWAPRTQTAEGLVDRQFTV